MLKHDIEDATGTIVSSKTVRKRLVKAGLTGCVAVKRALLTSAHKKKHLDWCREKKIGQLNNGGRCSGLMNQYLSFLLREGCG